MSRPPELPDRPHPGRDRLLRTLYRLGWRLAARLPGRLVSGLIALGAGLGRRHNGPHVRQLRANLSATSGQPCPDELVQHALQSYLRNVYEVLALPGWSLQEVVRRVTTVNEEVLRTAYDGPGAVVALPHSGNWDLAGAWACGTGMPVTTVAERLNDVEFAAFVSFREALGMQVLSHRDPGVIGDLATAVRRRRLVCLVADRDLASAGLPVTWAGRLITMPAGPAMVARRTGATLIAAVCQYTGNRMRIEFSDPISSRSGRAGLVAMTQDVADFFATTIARQPADWHMMQPFFAAPAARR